MRAGESGGLRVVDENALAHRHVEVNVVHADARRPDEGLRPLAVCLLPGRQQDDEIPLRDGAQKFQGPGEPLILSPLVAVVPDERAVKI